MITNYHKACKFNFVCLIIGLYIINSVIQTSVFNQAAFAAMQPSSSALKLAKRARVLASKGQLQEALKLTQQALKRSNQEHGSDHEYTGYMLDDVATFHYRLGKFQTALPFAQQAVKIIRVKRGVNSNQYASLTNNLATILLALGQFQEAKKFYQQSLEIFQSNPGSISNDIAQIARNLGIVYLEMSQFEKARQYFMQALEVHQEGKGSDSVEVGQLHLNLARVYLREEALEKARIHGSKAHTIFAHSEQAKIQDRVQADVILARIDIHESELTSALDKLTKALKKLDTASVKDTLDRASVLYNLGFVYILKGQLVEAEPIYKQVLAIYRQVVSEKHPAVARTLHSLAIVYKSLGKFTDAEKLYQRTINIFLESFGENDASIAATRLEYGLLLTEQGEPDKAIEQAEKALSIYQQIPGNWDIKKGYAKSSLGFALHRAGHLQEAAHAFEEATQLMVKIRGKNSSDLPPGLTQLGEIYIKQQRFDEADTVIKQAISIREKDAAFTPEGLAKSLSVLARLRVQQGRLADGLAIAKRYLGIIENRLDIAQKSYSASKLDEQRESRDLFEEYLTIAQAFRQKNSNDTLLAEMFKAAQFPHLSGTAAAITGMAARFAPDQNVLGKLVRQRQDAVEQWRAIDSTLTERLGGVRNQSADRLDQELKTKLNSLADKIKQFDSSLRQDFPEFAELTNPRPVELKQVQQLLKANEALFLHITGSKGSDLFLVRRDTIQVSRTQMNALELKEAVATIRKGFNLQNVEQLSDLPYFDTEKAFYLYQNLFYPLRNNLNGVQHIIVVLDGAMQNLPPTVLLTSPAKGSQKKMSSFSQMDFLGRDFSFSVIPSVSSFKALRSDIKPSKASKPFIGFGDPNFEGDQSGTRGVVAETIDNMVTHIDPAMLRSLFVPLPETRDELEALAKTFKATVQSLFFREQATETTVKNTELSQYNVIVFATHGLLAGEFRGLAEPALVLTPPKKASKLDDGLLTASEIARLKLDSDWVILSACNTAGPAGRPGAEGLSGLSKAFFYAGSRALLVSHWAVASDASVLLTTGAVKAYAENPKIGRAEALRRAMLTLLNQEAELYFAHPAFWAPFITVGEGGRY